MSSTFLHSFVCPYEEYSKEKIRFQYTLSNEEQKQMIATIDHVLCTLTSSSETIPYVSRQMHHFDSLKTALDQFFEAHPGKYFLRLNTRSPKDAWYQISEDADDEKVLSQKQQNGKISNPDQLTLQEIKRDLQVLCVTNSVQCIQVLCHSERVYTDLSEPIMEEVPPLVLLLDWNDSFCHDSETRCFLRGGKLIACSQYYMDLNTGYMSLPSSLSMSQFLELIQECLSKTFIPYQNCVADVIWDGSNVICIELNPHTSDTDAALFTWDELTLMKDNDLIVFRYMKDGNKTSIAVKIDK